MVRSNSAILDQRIRPAHKTEEGIFLEQLARAASDRRAGSYVVFPYCISVGILSFRRSSDIKFVPQGSSRLVAGLPQLLTSLLLGWWGIPWGILWTLQSIAVCLRGGRDLTPAVDVMRAQLMSPVAPAPGALAVSPAASGHGSSPSDK